MTRYSHLLRMVRLALTTRPVLMTRLALVLCFASIQVGTQPSAAEDAIARFENHIRPILANACVGCHGPTRQSANLRVDSRDALLQGGDSGAAIVPGNAMESLLVRAVSRHDDVSPMPPDEEKSLRSDQIREMVRWIDTGATWPADQLPVQASVHWAFVTPQRPAIPAPQDLAWCRTSVDRFIRARQEQHGILPAPVADKRTLIRRVTYDLTGLPPTPAAVNAFLSDDSPTAYEQLIDRLLASRAYGERWGRHWLDVIRYADTAGETADYPVPTAWRYRNYVIDSFHRDKPYDEFLREQVAGDVLAEQGPRDRYAERVTATGYLAISRRFGFDSENYHHLTIQDTIDTLGQSILGVSIGCARCHDHKFDPISMADYYALYGIFASSRYPFPGSEQKQRMRTLAPLVPRDESLVRWRQYAKQLAVLQRQMTAEGKSVPSAILRSLHDVDGDFELQAIASGGSNGVLVSPWLYQGPIAVTNAGQSPFQNCYAAGRVGVTIAATSQPYWIRQSLDLRYQTDTSLPWFVNWDVRVESPDAQHVGCHRLRLLDAQQQPVCEVLVSGTDLSLQLGDRSERIAAIRPNEWVNVQLAFRPADRTVQVRYGTPESVETTSTFSLADHTTGRVQDVVFDNVTTNGPAATFHFDNLAIQREPLSPVSTVLGDHAASDKSTAGSSPQADLERMLIEGPFPMAYGMAEGVPHDAPIQLRGEPERLGVTVERGFPVALGGGSLPKDVQGSGRAELAAWITSRDNPLTARVIANRVWQYHFGRGLVTTPNDFGLRGQPPTHPELLDHLATELMRADWSLKSLHRLILQSATYRQAAATSPEALTLAPNMEGIKPDANATMNPEDMYASFALRRLSAEEIRDAMLFVSGLLDESIDGPHPFPSPLHWGYTQHGPYSAVYDHDGRSVYLMTQRIKRHPFLALFDGPDPNATTAERRNTTVPTQALFFLNDPFVHRAAEAWWQRLTLGDVRTESWLTPAFRQAFGRPPTEAETADATAFIAEYASAVAANGSESTSARDPVTTAHIAYLRTLLASNEFLHVE